MNHGNRKFAESDWVNSTILGDISQPAPKVKVKRSRFEGFTDSRVDLENGCDVKEFEGDTIPAELMELFKFRSS